MSPSSSESAYVAIARKKQEQLLKSIPREWTLPAHLVPAGMLSLADSNFKPTEYQRVNVMHIPRTCGLLSSKEIEITEKWDVQGLVYQMTSAKLSAEDVVRAFCKVCR